jgi:hypothetical protein
MARAHLVALTTSVAAAATWLGADRTARADDTQACVLAYEQAQKLRKAHKLLAARAQLLACMREVCPEVLRADCGPWLDEVERALPSVVIAARDEAGRDVSAARALLDGGVIGERLDGNAVALDPGPHRIRLEIAGRPALEQDILVREGEKARLVVLRLPAAMPAEPASRPVPPLAYALGGLGVAALGSLSFFGLRALSHRSELDERGCKPACPQDEVDSVRRDYAIANVSLGVGVAALGLATVLFVTRPSVAASRNQATRAVRIEVRAEAAGGLAALALAF